MYRDYNKKNIQYIYINIMNKFIIRLGKFSCLRVINKVRDPLLVYFGKREGKPS